jgi:hypothetical protein
MKTALLFLCSVLNFSEIFSQKHDFTWQIGADKSVGIIQLNFNEFPVSISKITSPPLGFDLTNANFSGENGELLFYTNGIVVANMNHELMENGDSLNPGPTAYAFYDHGYIAQQGALILPIPENQNLFYLFHSHREEGNVQIPGPHSPYFYYSLIDMQANNGKGIVLEKNVVVISDTLDIGKLTATKHANGRDWWLLVSERNRYSYHRLLLTPDTILHFGIQPVEPVAGYQAGAAGFVSFSPDGTKYARHDIRGFPAGHFVRLYDFDRCTGMLSNQIHLPLSDTAGVGGIAFSPDSRFMYVSSQELVYQYDVTAADVAGTQTIVAETDGFIDTLFNGEPWYPLTFSGAQAGPDGRIYIHVAGSSRYLHVIQYPNQPGLECQVRQHAINLPAFNYRSIPNFPYYRLGPLDGSPCDTLGLDNHPLAGFTWEVTDTVGEPLTVRFNDNSFYEPETWSWDFGDGAAGDEVNPMHTFPADGVYTVCLTVSNQYDSDTFCREVRVETPSATPIPFDYGKILVFPNPAADAVNLLLYDHLPRLAELRLYDALGKEVARQRLNGGWNVMPLEGIAPGVYFYEVRDGERRLTAGKLGKVGR